MEIWEGLGINPEDFRGKFAELADGEGDGSGPGSFIRSLFEQLQAASESGDNPLEQFFGSRESANNEG